jgi:hypothetical protein
MGRWFEIQPRDAGGDESKGTIWKKLAEKIGSAGTIAVQLGAVVRIIVEPSEVVARQDTVLVRRFVRCFVAVQRIFDSS